MKKIEYISKLEQIKALSDPLRVNILMQLGNNPQNSQDLATALNIPRTRIHYHLKIMEEMGFIEVVDTDMINGIVQKYYLPTAMAFVPDLNIFSNLLSNEENVIHIDKLEEERFIKDFRELVERYKLEDTNGDTITYNLWKMK